MEPIEDAEAQFFDLPLSYYPFAIRVVGTHSGIVHREYEVTGPGAMEIENVAAQVGEYVYIQIVKDGEVKTEEGKQMSHTGCPWCDPSSRGD